MKKGTKNSIQEIILELLSRKRAHRREPFVQEVSLILEQDGERKVKPVYVVNRKIKQMHQDGLVTLYETHFSQFIAITKEGKKKLYQKKLLSESTILPRAWDGVWRIVILNMEREDKSTQDAVRYLLKKSHFVPLKAQVWFSPFPLEHAIEEMKKNLSLEEEIIILLAKHFDGKSSQSLETIFLEKIGEKDA